MKSTIYQHHLRASASFSYRHLLHCADAVDIGKTIHPHPTLGESIGMAAEVAHGSCTDVPPVRK